eukprot:COSAG01_NODE_5626_length_4135_cov_6.167988_3_plen_207_part_00
MPTAVLALRCPVFAVSAATGEIAQAEVPAPCASTYANVGECSRHTPDQQAQVGYTRGLAAGVATRPSAVWPRVYVFLWNVAGRRCRRERSMLFYSTPPIVASVARRGLFWRSDVSEHLLRMCYVLCPRFRMAEWLQRPSAIHHQQLSGEPVGVAMMRLRPHLAWGTRRRPRQARDAGSRRRSHRHRPRFVTPRREGLRILERSRIL